MKIFPILMTALLLFTTISHAQNIVNIIQSDQVQAVQTNEGLVRRLTGNVHLITKDAEIRADSAYHYVDKNEIEGFGNISIVTQSETIHSDYIRYDVSNEITSLRGQVIIENESTLIYSASALYSFFTEIALFNDPIWLKDSTGVMRANSGIYFNQTDSVAFFGDVQLSDSTQYIEADSLFTSRIANLYELFGNVLIQDLENKTDIQGQYVYADSTGKRIISGDARLRRVSGEASDTTWMSARNIEVNKVDSLNTIDAIGDVISIQKNNSARSDTLRYDENTGIFNLRSAPIVWYENIQLSGDSIDIFTVDDSLKSLHAIGNAFSVQEDSTTLRFNQMKGNSIIVNFDGDQVDQIHTLGNAELFLNYTDDEENPDGAISIRSTELIIYFENGEVIDVTALSNIDGETINESPDLSDFRLEGFRWNPELRPIWPDFTFEPRFDPIPVNPPFIRSLPTATNQKNGEQP
ncbi:MAG TPA: hypothetical protein DCE78_04465 [Bacteroidetes bacterium]|nr:hypothetical protein [Bacteroidota bacterium]